MTRPITVYRDPPTYHNVYADAGRVNERWNVISPRGFATRKQADKACEQHMRTKYLVYLPIRVAVIRVYLKDDSDGRPMGRYRENV